MMKYITSAYSRVVEAYNRLKQTLVDETFFPNCGLEFAVAGMPNNVARDSDTHKAIDSYLLQYNVNGWHRDGNRVKVSGDGVKKTVSLSPHTNGQHYSERDVLTDLRAKGLNPTSAIVKKIAKELDRLRRQRRT